MQAFKLFSLSFPFLAATLLVGCAGAGEEAGLSLTKAAPAADDDDNESLRFEGDGENPVVFTCGDTGEPAPLAPERQPHTDPSAPAAAAGSRPVFQLPFPCGESWRLGTYDGHDDYDIDMTANSGTTNGRPILASYSGTVSRAGWDDGGGWMVKIDHGGGWETLYLHMVEPPVVSVGQGVVIGQKIGRVGSTGNSSGPHLHYEQKADGNKVEAWFNGQPSGITSDGNPNTGPLYIDGSPSSPVNVISNNCGVTGKASVYGVLSDGRLTYSVIDAATGNRTKTVLSTASLGFTPKAMATMNFNTLLITSTAGRLYRVDIISNNTAVTFDPPVDLGGGWTHNLLSYDGAGNLFGIANGTLHRYGVTVGTHSVIVNSHAVIDSGFTLTTLTATGTNWILGTTSAGTLRSYKINGAGDWTGYTLDDAGWGFTHLLSPGGGVYYGRMAAGSMYHYLDAGPFNGSGADIQYFTSDPVDTGGWTQILLSAQPNTVS